MGVWDGNKETLHEDSKSGVRGLPGLPGKDAVLPKNILLDTGVVMKADIDMGSNSIINGAYLTQATDFVIRKYVDDNMFVLPSDLVNKAYIDNALSKIISKYGDYVHGDLNFEGSDGSMHSIFGIKMNNYNHCVATKQYVDNFRPLLSNFLKVDGTNSMRANLGMNNSRIEDLSDGIHNSDSVNLQQVNSLIRNASFDLPKAMAGPLNMNNNRITHLITIDDTDAASKAYVDFRNIPLEYKLHYNGNPYILTKIPPNQQTSYFIFHQKDKTYVFTNTHGVEVFDYLTDSELVFRISHNKLWDIFFRFYIKTIKDTFLVCEIWEKKDSSFTEVQNIKLIIKNTNNKIKVFCYQMSMKIDEDEILKIYLDNGHFTGGSACFIQANREVTVSKKQLLILVKLKI